jgi:folate-binding protein YgfZ
MEPTTSSAHVPPEARADALPRSYGDAAAEYAAVRRGVGVVDRSATGVVRVSGRDRAAFLHAMLSNDVKALAPGQGCRATLLDVHGKIQVIVVVLALDEEILVLTPPGRAAATVEALDRYLFSEKASLEDVTGNLAFLLLAGPEAPALAERLSGVPVPEAPWAHAAASMGGAAVRLIRGGGETGEPEVWIAGAAGAAAPLVQMVRDGGARPVGREALESLRIEAGTPLHGQDADDTVLLPEIPFDDLVSYSKGCYIGQEVVVRIRDRGHVNRHLVRLVLEGDAVPAAGAPLLVDGAEVGRVTSAAWSFGLGRPVALGFVRRQHAAPGAAVGVRVGDGIAPAQVSRLPLDGSAP